MASNEDTDNQIQKDNTGDDLFEEGISDDFPPKDEIEEYTIKKENSEEESNDIVISLSNPEKVGEGMSSYMVYRVTTKTSIASFRKSEFSAKRRFSDFLGLHSKLQAKHLPNGIIICPAPDKSVIEMTKMKWTKEEPKDVDFIERRRAALQRYMNRVARHKRLQMDPDFREFLEFDGDMPRAMNTQALSGENVLSFFKSVGSAVGKIAFKVEEVDKWFNQKTQEIDALEKQLSRLHSSFESLVFNRKDMATTTAGFNLACAALSSTEEHTALARALSHLTETTGKLEELTKQQAEVDFYQMTENIKDYLGLLLAVKESLNERFKAFKCWQDAELALTKKREQKVKLELAHKLDKISLVESEIQACISRVDLDKEHFERISETIKKEIATFDLERVHDFKAAVVTCLESMVAKQEKTIQYWEAYLPTAKAIA